MASNIEISEEKDYETFTITSDDEIEYELQNEHIYRPIRTTNGEGLTFSDMTKGFEFDTEEEKEDENKETQHSYWTREEIIKHLSDNPRPEDFCEDNGSYDERILAMDEILKDGVYKKLLKAGFGDVITEDSAVLYNLNAFLEGQDEPFDSTWLRGKPYLHRLNYDTVVLGLCKGLLTMRRGERSELIVRPEYAYLEMGCPPRVPPNASILYIVEVLKVFEEGSLAHFETLAFDDRNKIEFKHIFVLCDTERISGNSYFVEKRYREAAFRFRRAIRCLEQITFKFEDEEKQSKQLLLKLYVNIANTYNKIQRPFMAMSNCKRALYIDPNNIKALYQYGLAKMFNGDYGESRKLLKEALAIKPNQAISEALIKLDKRMAAEKVDENNLYLKMSGAFKL